MHHHLEAKELESIFGGLVEAYSDEMLEQQLQTFRSDLFLNFCNDDPFGLELLENSMRLFSNDDGYKSCRRIDRISQHLYMSELLNTEK